MEAVTEPTATAIYITCMLLCSFAASKFAPVSEQCELGGLTLAPSPRARDLGISQVLQEWSLYDRSRLMPLWKISTPVTVTKLDKLHAVVIREAHNRSFCQLSFRD